MNLSFTYVAKMADLKYQKCYEAIKRQSNCDEMYDALLEGIQLAELQSACKALVVGPGTGIVDLKLLAKLAPNLKKATFVEPDTSNFEKLKKNLLSGPFSVKYEAVTCHSTIQEWKSNGEKFDLILMSNCLYHLDTHERRDLFSACFNTLLSPGGLLFVCMTEDKCDGLSLRDIFVRVGLPPSHRNISDIKEDIRAIGQRLYKAYPVAHKYNIDLFQDDEIGFFQLYSKPGTTKEDVVAAIEAAKEEGFDGSSYECMCVFKQGY